MFAGLLMAAFYRDLKPENLSVPNVQIMQLIKYALGEDAQIDKLTQLILVSPALTAQLLGLVNSSFFGFRQQLKTISDAVVAVGLKSLRNLILCFAVKETLSKNDIPGFEIETFWEDSIRRGVAAQQLGYLVNGQAEKGSTLAGMMHLTDLCNAIYTCHDKSAALAELKKKSKMLFGLTEEKVESLLSLLPGWNLSLILQGRFSKAFSLILKKIMGLAHLIILPFICQGIFMIIL